MSNIDGWEIVRGIGQDATFVELWERSRTPGGMALDIVAYEDGRIIVTGYEVPVPFEVFEGFLLEARAYLAEYIEWRTMQHQPVEKPEA